MKEILISEQNTQADLILQVFWGLLSCEILLQREKETVEYTTLRKMKEFFERLLNDQSHTYQENMNHKAWLLHQILVYSFTNDAKKQPTADQQPTTDLFAEILIDRVVYGQAFLNLLQIKCQYLLRYLIASLLLSKNFEALQNVVLPMVLSEKAKYSDCFTQFVEALYEDFDFKKATELAHQIGKESQNDLLLKNYAGEIQAQAALIVYQIKSQIHRTIDLTNLVKDTGLTSADALAKLEENMEAFVVKIDSASNTLTIEGQLQDTKGKIITKTIDIVKRTNDLYKHYQQQMNTLNDATSLKAQ